MSAPDWWPDTAEEWLELVRFMSGYDDADQIERSARDFARHPERPKSRQYFEDLLDRSSSLEFEMQAFIAISADERRR